jgi:hypothetical protein
MSASPFDIRPVLLAKHAQHVVLIHFPIALFMWRIPPDHQVRDLATRLLDTHS